MLDSFSGYFSTIICMAVAQILLILILKFILKEPKFLISSKENLKLKESQMWEYVVTWLSILHAILTSAFSLWVIFIDPQEINGFNSHKINLILSYSFSYFVVDLVFGVVYKYNDFIFHVHSLTTRVEHPIVASP